VKEGLRQHKSASVRIGLPDLPLEASASVRQSVRELVDLKSGNQRKGHATALLHQVCDEADEGANVLMLMVSQPEEAELSNERLVKWYSRFGFKPTKDGLDSPIVMIRPRMA
jgi:hypothetical protein